MNDDTNEHRAVARYADGSDAGAEGVRRRARQRLQTEGLDVGTEVLIELAKDKQQKGSTRGAAAKALVQAGISTAHPLSLDDIAEMPAEQIRVLLAEAERALAARMAELKTIEHVPAVPRPRLDAVKNTRRGSLFD
jgi:hypothetical protein